MALGVHRTTAERWRKRQLGGCPLRRRRGPRRVVPEGALREEALHIVRATHGLVGASAISHGVAGLSRRAAAEIKQEALRQMEIDRRAQAQRVIVTSPGIVRGFDGMDLGRGRGHLLVAADGCVPYRTSWVVSARHDELSVAKLLAQDFERNGAPLVLRLDRAAAHDAPAVCEVLHAHAVLALHGAPHHARYYGQLERQNREHRAWLGQREEADLDVEAMMWALNGRWRRGTLGWSTAVECWAARPVINVDRRELAEEVEGRMRRLDARLEGLRHTNGLARRLAIRHALTARGYLRIEPGGWC